MVRWFERLLAGAPAPAASPYRVDDATNDFVPVRFRPRLIAQLLQDHEALRVSVRALIDACRRRDEDARIVGLRHVAAMFRRLSLTKATLLYPYLRWGLQNDRVAARQFVAVHGEVLRVASRVEAVLDEYLAGPWLGHQRRRLVADVAKAAQQLAALLKQEEACVFPLYLPPGQYRHVRDVTALTG